MAGSGIVACTLIKLLAQLPARIVWLTTQNHTDSTNPQEVPNAELLATTDIGAISALPSGTRLAIMTDDHELDIELCALALEHGALSYIGCLGSSRKARLLCDELRRRGFSRQQLKRVISPAGLPQISGKHPALVATSVAAQMLCDSSADNV